MISIDAKRPFVELLWTGRDNSASDGGCGSYNVHTFVLEGRTLVVSNTTAVELESEGAEDCEVEAEATTEVARVELYGAEQNP